MRGTLVTLAEFFEGYAESRRLYSRLWQMLARLGKVKPRVTRSQIAFRRRKAFAWAWIPGRYLKGKVAPLVLTIVRRDRDPSARWKEVVEVTPGCFMHHLELNSSRDLDAQVRAWLGEAWEDAA